MISRLALVAIDGYQRYLSPRKGYSCAHRIAYGGPGCSGFAKGTITEMGLWREWPLIKARFAACRNAAAELRAKRKKEKKDR
jgi:putative component of membrane protein insertase Oxa1/YidC/SpoIIIJ protein YidD